MIRTEPRPGDIMLTTITGPVGGLIAAGEWLNGNGFGIYQHAAIVLNAYPTLDGWGGTVLEAQPGGARQTPIARYHGRHTVYVSPVGLSDMQRRSITTAAVSYEDVPYSFLDYGAIAAHRLHLPWPGLRRYVASTRHMICSQLCTRAYKDAGIELFRDGRWEGYCTPMDLWNLLRHPADNVLTLAA